MRERKTTTPTTTRETKAEQRARFEIPSQVQPVYLEMKKFGKLTRTLPLAIDVQEETFNPGKHLTMQYLMEAGVHLGHSVSCWNPRMAPYIFGIRNGIHIIDLHKTIVLLRRALHVIREIARRNGIILFVCSNPKTEELREQLVEDARRCEQYPLVCRWPPGLLTNSYRILGSDEFLPDLVIFLDMKAHEDIGISEAARAGVSTIAICDTNCDPSRIDYLVPGNNDSVACIRLFSRLFSNAALEGRQIGLSQLLFDDASSRRETRRRRRPVESLTSSSSSSSTRSTF
jgi:small subunit ribosomal protein S2